MINNILIVGAGSCLGGMARYIVSRAIGAVCHTPFPWGTLTVNVAGCLIIGLIYGLIDRGISPGEGWRLFLTVGFCGGFTTFSTFMHENYLLFGGNHLLSVALYLGASVIAGFIMVYFGYYLTRLL